MEIEYMGTIIDVDFYHQPAEKATREYPGCEESFDVLNVEYKGVNITQFLWDTNEMHRVEEALIKQLKDKY